MTAVGEFTFVCPACGETARVDASVRELMLEDGCIMCGAAVKRRAFTPVRE